LTGVLFGAAPVLDTLRVDLSGALKAGASGSGSPRSRLRSGLLIAQVALSTVLLVGAGLFVRTLKNATAEGPAQGASHLLLARMEPAMRGYEAARGQRFYEETLRRVRGIPGVNSGALVFIVPFGGMRGGTDIVAPDGNSRQVDFNVVSPGYFQTAGLALLGGREFLDADNANAAGAAIVNEPFAARFWPGENPIGKPIHEVHLSRVWTVVGVVRDGKVRGYRDALRPCFYVPAAQDYRGEMTLEVRTNSTAAALAPAVRREIQAADASVALLDLQTMETWLADALSQERLIASFTSGLGILALVLAAIGVYGMLSFSVSRRTREIGIRMALGARPIEVSRMVFGESARLAGTGLALGAGGAIVLARLAKTLLYGVTPGDPAAFGIAFAVLGVVAAGAALAPAYRASRLHPAETLRSE
jgi:predicted permease